MDGIGFETVLSADPRPSFVIDILDTRHIGHVEPVASNIAFRSNAYLCKLMSQEQGSASKLRAWISRPSHGQAAAKSDYECDGPDGTRWFAWTIRERWRVVQLVSSMLTLSIDHEPQVGYPTPPEDEHQFDHTNQTSIALPVRNKADKRASIMRAFDITPDTTKNIAGLEELIGNMCDVDWESTAMGPIENWPPELCQPIHTILLQPDQSYLMFLGPDHNLVYNVAYANLAGDRHPAILGAPLYEAWHEAADMNRASFEYIDTTGAPYVMKDHPFCVDRNGFLEEVYVRWTTTNVKCSLPVYLCTCSESTQRVRASRRHDSLIKVNQTLPDFANMSELWDHVIRILGANEDDFPLGFVYSKSTTTESAYCLQGIFGHENGSNLLPHSLDYASDKSELAKVFGQAERTLNPIRISESEGLPTKLIDACASRSFGDRCTEAMVCSLRRATDNEVMAIMVVGLHTRKKFDFDDEMFFQNTSRSVSDLAFNVYTMLLGEQLAKEAELQNAKHETLIKALSTSTSEFTYASSKLQRILHIVEKLDVGIYEFDTSGRLLQANESYFKLSGHPRGVNAAGGSWLDCMYEEDLPQAHKNWEMLLAGESINFEIRFKKRATSPSSEQSHFESEEPEEPFVWVLCACTPVMDPVTGQLASISGCLTNISAAKRSQNDILKRTEALERARASEQRFLRFTEFAACPVCIHKPDLSVSDFIYPEPVRKTLLY